VTEHASQENAVRSEMRRRKLWDWKMRHQYAGVENAGQSSMESLFANKSAKAVEMHKKIKLSEVCDLKFVI